MNVYKIKVDLSEPHECDCEYCEIENDNWERELIIKAASWEDVRAAATAELNDELTGSDSVIGKIEKLDCEELPDDKFFLDGYIIHEDDRYATDGFVLLEKRLVFIFGDPPRKRLVNQLKDTQPDYRLGEYTVTDGIREYEEGGFKDIWVTELEKIGIEVWAVKGGTKTSPFALVKEGAFVGVIMPSFKS